MENKKNINVYHGGRLGDVIYSLYAVKAYLEKNNLGKAWYYLSLYHAPKAWNDRMLRSLLPFIRQQDYIEDAYKSSVRENHRHPIHDHFEEPCSLIELAFDDFDIDFIDIESKPCPEELRPYLVGSMPGNLYIPHRYGCSIGLSCADMPLGEPWLTAKKTLSPGLVVHAPRRRSLRNPLQWEHILNTLGEKYKVTIIGDADIGDWCNVHTCDFRMPEDISEMADYINSSDAFLGFASVGNVIAEGLGKDRFVEIDVDCHNTWPYTSNSVCLNLYGWNDIVTIIDRFYDGRDKQSV